MNTIRIVGAFLSKAKALSECRWQKEKASKEGRIISKVEITNAYELYKTNGWFKHNPFKKLGLPNENQFMVIVYYENSYKSNTVAKPKVRKTITSKNKCLPCVATILVPVKIHIPACTDFGLIGSRRNLSATYYSKAA